MPTDSEHIEALRRGPRSWNHWRARNPSLIPNLVGITLGVSERQLGPINGGPINLASARLRRASLRFATLTAADLAGADLSDADLRAVRLDRANLTGANLSGAVLDDADFRGAKLDGADVKGVNLRVARNLGQSQLDAAVGDEHTVLPGDLTRPRSWTESMPQNLSFGQTQRESNDLGRIAQPGGGPGASVSWLVGGPHAASNRGPAT